MLPSNEEQELEIVLSPQNEVVDYDSDEDSPIITIPVNGLIELAEKKKSELVEEMKVIQEEVQATWTAYENATIKMKEKQDEIKLWQKKVSSPTTSEVACLCVRINSVNRQLHNDSNGIVFYRTDADTRTNLKLSATTYTTRECRDRFWKVRDGKKGVAVHIKDKSVTVNDLIEA